MKSGYIKQAILRGGIPFVIMGGIALIMRSQGMDGFQVRSTFITGIIISVVAAASVIYDVASWSIKKQSVVHFLLMLVTIFPCLLISGWFPLTGPFDYLKVLLYFLLAGLLLWSFFYFLFSKVLKK